MTKNDKDRTNVNIVNIAIFLIYVLFILGPFHAIICNTRDRETKIHKNTSKDKFMFTISKPVLSFHINLDISKYSIFKKLFSLSIYNIGKTDIIPAISHTMNLFLFRLELSMYEKVYHQNTIGKKVIATRINIVSICICGNLFIFT